MRSELVEAQRFAWYTPGTDYRQQAGAVQQVYIRPRASNNPTWDALLITTTEVLILQYTVAEPHAVVGSEVVELLNSLDPAGKLSVRFAFVVPDASSWSV